jgi:hypothetical protein
MDPNECLKQVVASLAIGDYVEAELGLADLNDWLRSGGFKPNVQLLKWEWERK